MMIKYPQNPNQKGKFSLQYMSQEDSQKAGQNRCCINSIKQPKYNLLGIPNLHILCPIPAP
jgi:hypothetical protein